MSASRMPTLLPRLFISLASRLVTKGLADAALAGDNADDVLDVAALVRFKLGGAGSGAARRIPKHRSCRTRASTLLP